MTQNANINYFIKCQCKMDQILEISGNPLSETGDAGLQSTSNRAADSEQKIGNALCLEAHAVDTLMNSLPEKLAYLFPVIEKSESILLLEDDWDDEGSEGYDKVAWEAAVKFLMDYAQSLYQDFNIQIDVPKVYPGPKGSIDIIWEVEQYRLVVNVNKNGEDVMFYADNYKNQTTEGTFKLLQFNHLLFPIAIHTNLCQQ